MNPLFDILVMQLEQSSGNSPPFNTLVPWLLVHRVMSLYEKNQPLPTPEKNKQDQSTEEEKMDTSLEESKEFVTPRSSTQLLNTVHEELGK